MVCIAHTGATQVNNPRRHQGSLRLGLLGKAACMAREYLGHPQSRWRLRLGAQVGTQAATLLFVALQLREVPCARYAKIM